MGKLLTKTQERCGLARDDPELCSNAWIEYFTSMLFPFGSFGTVSVQTAELFQDCLIWFMLVVDNDLANLASLGGLWNISTGFALSLLASQGIPLILFVAL